MMSCYRHGHHMRQTPAASSVQPRHSPISDIRCGDARTGDRSRDKLSERSEETRGDIRSADITEAARGRAMPDGAARVTRVEAAPLMSRAELGLV